MKRYKYKIVRTNKEVSEAQLNTLGRQGWELCGVTYDNVWGLTYYIKKEIEETNG
jgi:hypothetical protein